MKNSYFHQIQPIFAIKKFRPIRGLHCGHVTLNGGLWLVEIFQLQIWHLWAILRLFYPWSNFDPGIISIFFSPKSYFWGPFEHFFFDASKKRSIMVYFEKKIFKRRWDQKLRCQNFNFWNAHISLVNALIFTCSNPLRPCCQ